MSPKKRNGISVRLSDEDGARYAALADATKVPLAVMIRLLLDAAEKCVAENDGWPSAIDVVKSSRASEKKLAVPKLQPWEIQMRNALVGKRGSRRGKSKPEAKLQTEINTYAATLDRNAPVTVGTARSL